MIDTLLWGINLLTISHSKDALLTGVTYWNSIIILNN